MVAQLLGQVGDVCADVGGFDGAGLGLFAAGDAGKQQDCGQTCALPAGNVGAEAVADHGGVVGCAAQPPDGFVEDDGLGFADDGGFYASGGFDDGDDGAGTGQRAKFAGEGGIGVGADEGSAFVDEECAHGQFGVGDVAAKASDDERGGGAIFDLFGTDDLKALVGHGVVESFFADNVDGRSRSIPLA